MLIKIKHTCFLYTLYSIFFFEGTLVIRILILVFGRVLNSQLYYILLIQPFKHIIRANEGVECLMSPLRAEFSSLVL